MIKIFIFFLGLTAWFRHSTPPGILREKPVQDSCSFDSNGRNIYFILEPGYRLELEGTEANQPVRLVITVLHETRKIGGVVTRVVEEKESVNGEPVEISRNFFAICRESKSIYYFGEEVDLFRQGRVVGHEGAWLAEGKNRAGIIMPGSAEPGARFEQENAPGIAMDRMEIISVEEKMQTPAGRFSHVLKTKETSPLEPGTKEYKYFAPGVGLIRDGNLRLVKYGFGD